MSEVGDEPIQTLFALKSAQSNASLLRWMAARSMLNLSGSSEETSMRSACRKLANTSPGGHELGGAGVGGGSSRCMSSIALSAACWATWSAVAVL